MYDLIIFRIPKNDKLVTNEGIVSKKRNIMKENKESKEIFKKFIFQLKRGYEQRKSDNFVIKAVRYHNLYETKKTYKYAIPDKIIDWQELNEEIELGYFQGLKKFSKKENVKLNTYLFSIWKNIITKYIGKKKKENIFNLEYISDLEFCKSKEDNQNTLELYDLLSSKLTLKQKKIIISNVFYKKNVKKIAQILKVSGNTADRIKKEIIKILEKEYGKDKKNQKKK